MDITPLYRIKILFVHHGTGIGGSPISLLNIINNLNPELFNYKVLFLKNSDVVELFRKDNIPVRVLDSFFYKKIYLYFFHSEAGYFKLYDFRRILKIIFSWIINSIFIAPKIIEEEDCDIVYLNSSFLSDWAFAASRVQKKVICHIREPIAAGNWGIRRKFLRIVLEKCADKIIAISNDNAMRLNLPGKTEVVYNSVSNDFLEKSINLDNPSIGNIYYILYVGGYSMIKGFHILVDSLSKLNKNVKVYFLGYYPDLANLSLKQKIRYFFGKDKSLRKSLIEMRNSANAIEIGNVENIFNYMQKSSLLVFPSTVPHFARPIVEAMFFHLPVLASSVEGMDEIVIDGLTGKLVKPNDPFALAHEINKFAEANYDINKMKNCGYDFVNKWFLPSNNKVIEKIIMNTTGI